MPLPLPKSAHVPWEGLDRIERDTIHLHNRLAAIAVYGVQGLTPNSEGLAQVPRDHAQASLDAAYVAVGRYKLMRAPGGVHGRAQRFVDRQVADLERLIDKVERIRRGAKPMR